MLSSKFVQIINVFISSPSDVKAERDIVLQTIERLNSLSHIASQFVIKPLAYETLVPPSVGDKPQKVVDRYMMESKNADILICMLWSRMGTPIVDEKTGEEYLSGTHYEFLNAYRENQDTGKPYILLYKGDRPLDSSVDPDQLKQVRNFFADFEGADAKFKGLYRQYKSLKQFEDALFSDLDKVLADFIKSNANKAPNPEQTSKPKIFVSYARADLDAIKPVVQTLKTHGYDVWTDIQGIPGGARWLKHLEESITNCDIFMPMISTNFKASDWSNREILYALNLKKVIIPFFIEDTDTPLAIADLQAIEFNRDMSQNIRLVMQYLDDTHIQPDAPIDLPTIPDNPDILPTHSIVSYRRNILKGFQQ